ncbi:type II toxin-antitoxin system RelE/ParE family toxin [Salinimicrobium sp. CDJ15-81-2]|nr:type II toxin-antitoxin system RelE/ParE family toxin [Salinimicrobium nanhaiense]
MKVFLSELAENKLLRLNDYLLEKWDKKTRDLFFRKLNDKIEQISLQPESCPRSNARNGLYRCVVTKQTTFYYRILKHSKEIEIITVFDTRQNPDKLTEDLS